jgi:hypothetical protein
MYSHKRIALTLLVLFGTAAAVAIVTRSGHSQSNSPNRKTVKVLRRASQIGQPPTAQEIAAAPQASPTPQREFEDKIPKHIPIKVKVKHLNNERWARDLEIEVENRSDKPIYYLRIVVSLPDVRTENDRALAFPLSYGRDDFIDFYEPLRPDDVPLKPGETYTFRIPEELQEGWEQFVKRRGVPKDEPKKVYLRFQLLNFGDGTGFHATDGVPADIHKKRAGGACVDEKKGGVTASAANDPPVGRSGPSLQLTTFFLPASFLPVNVSVGASREPANSGATIRMDTCCPGSPCSHIKIVKHTCCGMTVDKAGSAACSDSLGFCGTYATEDVSCNNNIGSYCIEDLLLSCSSQPTPTPTPTPNPTPSPSPTPTSCPPADERFRPNPTCTPLPAINCGYVWICDPCPGGERANYPAYGTGGCPSNMYNVGGHCCVCVQPPENCQQGYVWSTSICHCVPDGGGGGGGDVGGEGGGGGGGGDVGDCTPYYYVHYECYVEAAAAAPSWYVWNAAYRPAARSRGASAVT